MNGLRYHKLRHATLLVLSLKLSDLFINFNLLVGVDRDVEMSFGFYA